MTTQSVARPPYRADIVGSFLRPRSVHEARQAHYEAGTLSAEGLKAIEDEAIRDVIAMQEEVGLKAVTDGEFRRAWWHFDFMGMLNGLDIDHREAGGIQFQHVHMAAIDNGAAVTAFFRQVNARACGAGPIIEIQGSGEQARRCGLTHPAYTGQHEGVGDTA